MLPAHRSYIELEQAIDGWTAETDTPVTQVTDTLHMIKYVFNTCIIYTQHGQSTTEPAEEGL